jgi:hypothetical protein
MLRWYGRFQETSQGRTHSAASDNYVDEIYAFFLNCHILKDWIKNDPALPSTVQRGTEKWIENSPSLCLCAELCNGLKHLKRDSRTSHRSGKSPDFGKKHFAMRFSDRIAPVSSLVPCGLPTVALAYELDTSDGPKDAFQLATDCVAAWKEFWTTHSL